MTGGIAGHVSAEGGHQPCGTHLSVRYPWPRSLVPPHPLFVLPVHERCPACVHCACSCALLFGAAHCRQSGGRRLYDKYVAREPSQGSRLRSGNIAVCGTCCTGHFTAHVRDPLSGRWFCHNDSHVLPLDPTSHTIQVDRPRDCYVLLYQHTGL